MIFLAFLPYITYENIPESMNPNYEADHEPVNNI